MKFTDVKERIDKFFKEKSSEEIYNFALSYGFEQVDDEYEELGDVDFGSKKVIIPKYQIVTFKVEQKSSYEYEKEDELNYSKIA